MAGLISYPRVSDGGPPGWGAILAILDGSGFGGGPAQSLAAVRAAVEAYRGICSEHPSGKAAEEVVSLGVTIRDAIIDAVYNGHLTGAHASLVDLTTRYADVWKSEHPISSTSYGTAVAAVEAQRVAAIAANDASALRDAQEELGVLAARFELSALAGAELSGIVGGIPSSIAGSKFQAVYANATVRHLECAGAYSLNICVVVQTKSGRTFYLTAEAKGGRSAIGTARDPRSGQRVTQDSLEYSRVQAEHMRDSRNPKAAEVRSAKNQMGRALVRAHRDGLALHATARMAGGAPQREHIE